MSKKFNLDDYKGKYVMHCKTEEEAEDFCRVLHEAGRTWRAGNSYLKDSYWDYYMNDIYYMFNEGGWHDHLDDYYKDSTILEWSDFMNKEFTKEDLRNGDIVLRRDEDVEMFIDGRFIDYTGFVVNTDGLNYDLTNKNINARDIIAIRRPDKVSDISFDAFEKDLGRLIYERDETVEMTLEEVCKALGKNVKIVKE
jgi:hypothetical protein